MIIFCLVLLFIDVLVNLVRLRTILFSKEYTVKQASRKFGARLFFLFMYIYVIYILISNYARL